MPPEVIDHTARAQLGHLVDRISHTEDHISDFRKTVVDLNTSLIKLQGPVRWMERLAFVIAVGILSTLGVTVWNTMQARFPDRISQHTQE